MGERVRGNRHLRYSHVVSLGWGNIRREVCREMLRFDPPVAVAVRLERLGSLRQLLLDRGTTLPFIERKGGDVYQGRNVWIVTSFGDDGSPVAVTNQDDRPTHGVDCGLCIFLVV